MKIERKTVEYDEEFLRQISKDVDFNKDNYLEYIEQLKNYCRNNTVYALSPVQIGIPKRMIYIRNTTTNMNNNMTVNYDESIIYINPIITTAKGKTTFLEGCASCIYNRDGKTIYYVGTVDRPYKIDITYYDIRGNKKFKSIEGFEATVFCHEYDHLNGVLHIDKSEEKFEMTLDEMKEYRLKHPYKIVSTDSEYNLK